MVYIFQLTDNKTFNLQLFFDYLLEQTSEKILLIHRQLLPTDRYNK